MPSNPLNVISHRHRQFTFAALPAAVCVSLALACSLVAVPPSPRGKAATHWAFQPVQRPAVPVIVDSGKVIANPVDAFILARLRERKLEFAAPAREEVRIRRTYLDLIGLPPSPAELEAALRTPHAALVDELLTSPHHGERWARHWLDVARYAETDGFEHDAVRPHSWRYRDYVIRAFNADKPFDRFIREQLAGDELWAAAEPAARDPGLLVATGFNLLGPDMVDSADQVQRRLNTLNDMTDTTALAFLGLTIGCARCHDHPFEPLSQRDYFRLQAFFTPVEIQRDTEVATAADRAEYEAARRGYEQHPLVRELAALERPFREQLVRKGTRAEKIAEKDLVKVLDGSTRAKREALLKKLAKVPKPSLPKAMTLAVSEEPAVTRILHRGDYNQPKDEVRPGVPAALPGGDETPAQRRDLAEWIASPANPLTARVMVNRLWKHHFGKGLVGTPSDFGVNGRPPSHPELLDWLASEFIRSGWSLKAMHRLMLNSTTWRQSADAEAGTLQADPANEWYSRWSPARLEGEVIRDSLLAIGGVLNRELGGPGVFPPIPAELFEGARGWSVSADARDHNRRSIYIFARRNLRFPFLEVFDAPDSNLSCASREQSTTAPQSLTLLNAGEVLRAAAQTARLIERDAAQTAERITEAYRRILARPPSGEEAALAREFLTRSPLSELCRVLFNLNEFVYAN